MKADLGVVAMADIKILVPTDNSQDSQISVEEGASLAKLVGGHLLCVAVQTTDADEPDDSQVGPREAEAAVNLARVVGSQMEVDVETRIEKGDAVKALVKVIEEVGVDMVVMGTRGRAGLDRLFMGSVTEALIRKRIVPVMVFGRHSGRQFHSAAQDHIGLQLLATTDGSETSMSGIEEAMKWAIRMKATLHLLCVNEDPTTAPDDGVGKTFHATAVEGSKQGVQVSHSIVTGDPVREILRASQGGSTDLVVMSTHGRGMGGWLLGSTTRDVFQMAMVPVLVVPRR